MSAMNHKSIVWTIAGSDVSGGAGIQADMRVFQYFGLHGASIITAITAQNSQKISDIYYVFPEHIHAQLHTVQEELKPKAIKIGMLGQIKTIEIVIQFLKDYTGHVVLDPVMIATSGRVLFNDTSNDYVNQLRQLFPYVDLITPNIPEAESMLDMKIDSYDAVENAAKKFILLGCKNVFIKGGHLHHHTMCHDYWTNGKASFWLSSLRHQQKNYRGTGCTLSSVMTSALALGYEIKDAMVIAKMYVNRAIRLAKTINMNSAFIHHASWPEDQIDMPYLSTQPLDETFPAFPRCNEPLGLYPIVDSSEWMKTLLPLGVKTIQLRIKNKTGMELEEEIKTGIQLAKQFNAQLFVNDYWELALAHDAYGVHLGQEDLTSADMQAIRQANLRLGISTHCYHEVARAHTFQPSYMACGPIFATTSKVMPFAPQGLDNLKRWRRTLPHYPLVAIGGIDAEKIPDLLATRVDGIAMISAITASDDPIKQTKRLLQLMDRNYVDTTRNESLSSPD